MICLFEMKKEQLPKIIPIFPLSNFIIFPKTTVPLNIFEPRYIEMINDSMKSNKLIGMIQPKSSKKSESNVPELHEIGCLGKIISFKETDVGGYLVDLKGIVRFRNIKEIKTNKKYRECETNYDDYLQDLSKEKEPEIQTFYIKEKDMKQHKKKLINNTRKNIHSQLRKTFKKY